ncbi:MATE family efflux transporter [Clostridium aestuarii]|uniref:Probable multidrug resistance protein NorM n=1 Tax=Clostridium aestuarii TaxID=338193 RepID=A0ABT4CYG7_9CLOT|nr:MATE family efflux transporter [Clostridium aestuarii]MCY6483427.1 MATE family efflux transporter [Clostridium aestuarii]
MEHNNKDLLQGSVTSNLLKMSLPTMLGFLFQSAYDLVDMIWIGKISSSAIAGVTIFVTIFWMVDILNQIIGTSSISLISQSYGSGDMEKTSRAIEQTLTFKALVAVIAGVIMLMILKPLIGFFTKDAVVIKNALDYGYIRIFFLPIMFSSFTVNTAFRCIGDAKKPMIIMIIAAIFNIILDPIFIFKTVPYVNIPGLNLGIFGAALATVISTVIAFGIGFYIFLSGKTKVKIKIKRLFKLNAEMDKKLITVGLPSGFEMLSRNLSGILTLKFVTIYGTAAIACMGIGNKLFSFAFMPLVGLSMGGSAIVGQCIGSEKIDRAKDTAAKAAVIGIVFMSVLALIGIAFPEKIMDVFTDDNAVIHIGILMIRIVLPALTIAAASMGLGCVFSGSGYNIPFLVSSLVSRWAIQVPLLVVVTYVMHLPIIWVWVTYITAEVGEILVMFTAYKKGKWKNMRA